jgi:ribonuclease P protein component
VSYRLRKHADYQRVYKAGRKQFGRQMAYFFALRDEAAAARCEAEGPRIGLTVPKALGNAVARNRIKRRLREAVRQALPRLSAPVDVVLHPKRSVLEAEFAAIMREVETIFRSIEARSIEARSIDARVIEARSVQAAAAPSAAKTVAETAETAEP